MMAAVLLNEINPYIIFLNHLYKGNGFVDPIQHKFAHQLSHGYMILHIQHMFEDQHPIYSHHIDIQV